MPRPETAAGTPARRTGMTLLEVLAAVAVLGLLYTVLAGVAMQGLRAEGESRRRLEASLLADQLLADLEGGSEVGAVPPLGQTESEQDGFVVETTVSPFELSVPEAPNELQGDRAAAEPGLSFLASAQRGAVSALRRIDVRVVWIEGQDEQEVSRITFAFDREAVRGELDLLDAASGAQETQEGLPESEVPPEEGEPGQPGGRPQ